MGILTAGVASPYVFATGSVFSATAVLVSVLGLSLSATVLAAVPLAWFATLIIARGMRGLPNTMSGMNRLTGPWIRKGIKRYTLVTMPLNHFGEKCRFVMDLVGAPYEEKTTFGILTLLVRGRTIPWLVDRMTCSSIGNSDQILSYLATEYVPTLPAASQAKAEVLLRRTAETRRWEARLNGLGHAVQGYGYFYILHETMPVTFSAVTWGADDPHVPLLERLLLRLCAPLLKGWWMREGLKLGGKDAVRLRDKRKAKILETFDEVDAALAASGGPYILGKHLSYVDISFAALVRPLQTRIFATPASRWANGRFSSISHFAERQPGGPAAAEAALPHGKFKAFAEFQDAFQERPCGKLVERVYERRGEKF